jgi:hypothetical protein
MLYLIVNNKKIFLEKSAEKWKHLNPDYYPNGRHGEVTANCMPITFFMNNNNMLVWLLGALMLKRRPT